MTWETFVAGVPECAELAGSGNTLNCLRNNASFTGLVQGMSAVLASPPEAIPWNPVIDGEGGLFPDYPSNIISRGDFSHLPFISGTNLDEGVIPVLIRV